MANKYKKLHDPTTRDVRDLLWDLFKKLISGEIDDSSLEGKTFLNIAKELCGDDVESFVIEMGTEWFTYELNHFRSRPNLTMIHMWHDEVGLSDGYLCEQHRFFMRISTDYMSYIPGQVPVCPDCNTECFYTHADAKRKEDYINAIDCSRPSDEMISIMKKMEKSSRKFWKNYQLKDDIREFKRYVLYKLGLSERKF